VVLRYVRLIFLSLLSLVFVVFAVVNRGAVGIDFYPFPYSAEMPKFLLAILCFALGAVVAWMVMCIRMAKFRQQFSAEHKRVMALENELQGMQAMTPNRTPVALDK
jgi:uncharacterized integral membrane protein